MQILFLGLTVLFIELYYKPRLDYTREIKLLLWYGVKNRKYVILINN